MDGGNRKGYAKLTGKNKVERVCGLREGGALRFITSTFFQEKNEP